MGKLKKTIVWAVSVLAAGIIVIVLAIGIFADFALKTAVETAGTKALNVGVKVDKTDLGITSGTLTIENLIINNPPGYQHPKMLDLKNAYVKVDISSLLSDTVKISEMNFDGIEIVVEQKGISENNLKAILGNIKENRKKPAPEEDPAKEGKKLVIDNLEIRNVTVKVQPIGGLGKAGTITLKLAPITMKNLGSESKLTTAKLTEKIMLAITGGIAKQGGKLPGELLGTITGELKKFEKLPGGILKTGENILKQGGKSIEGTKKLGEDVIKEGGKLGEGIKNIFGGEKEASE
jgi:hypothetical protein